jgi:hypothetical protein
MPVRHQLAFTRQLLQRFFLEVRQVAFDVIEYLWFEHKEGPINPAFFGLRLF